LKSATAFDDHGVEISLDDDDMIDRDRRRQLSDKAKTIAKEKRQRQL
jgi:hypothetical protein